MTEFSNCTGRTMIRITVSLSCRHTCRHLQCQYGVRKIQRIVMSLRSLVLIFRRDMPASRSTFANQEEVQSWTKYDKHSKLPKYYGQNYLRKFLLHITSLITIEVSEQCPNLCQNRKNLLKKPSPTNAESFLMPIIM